MTPYYDRDGITIYCGDCREILPHLPKVDLVLTDPPYGKGYSTGRRKGISRPTTQIQHDKDLSVVAEAWPLALQALKDPGHWYAVAAPGEINTAVLVFTGYSHLLAWDKGNRGTAGDRECGFGESWEAIFYGTKGRRPLNGSRPRTVIRHDWSGTMDPQHPTVKPVPLLCRMIEWSSAEGETVLDPFMGSGTTLAAARNLNRKAIGIEIEERYCEIAVKRLAQGLLPLSAE